MPFSIVRDDLSRMDVDAVVVAANERLVVSGGVGATVAQAAGYERVQQACSAIGGCATGSAVLTPGFGLPARFIVHAVGPVWQGGSAGEVDVLRSTYESALRCAFDAGARSVGVSLISAGTYGFPPSVSFAAALDVTKAFLEGHDLDIVLVLYGKEAVAAGLKRFKNIAEYIDDHYVEQHPSEGNAILADSGGVTALFDTRTGERILSFGEAGEGSCELARSAPPPGSPASVPSVAPGASRPAPQGMAEPAPRKAKRGLLSRLKFRDADGHHAGESRKDAGGAALADVEVDAETAAAAVADAETDAAAIDAGARSAALADAGARGAAPADAGARMPIRTAQPMQAESLERRLQALDASFSVTVLALIDARGLADSQVYKKANMSRQLFSKIRSDAQYRPTKKTALALAVALELNLEETGDLLRRAGYALSNSNKADVIVEYFISTGAYDIFAINEALYAFDQPLL